MITDKYLRGNARRSHSTELSTLRKARSEMQSEGDPGEGGSAVVERVVGVNRSLGSPSCVILPWRSWDRWIVYRLSAVSHEEVRVCVEPLESSMREGGGGMSSVALIGGQGIAGGGERQLLTRRPIGGQGIQMELVKRFCGAFDGDDCF